MTENYYAVIMAGGGGTRLWPLSRNERPKQMLKLVGDRTLYQVAVDRLADMFPPERILVVTTAQQAEELQSQRPEIPQDNFVLEPGPRGTASAIGLSAVVLQKRDPDAVMAVVTADHYIDHEDRFMDVLKAAYQAAQEDYLVTLGIIPTSPATGFGYIQQGTHLETYNNMDVFHALRFKEKPDRATAAEMLDTEDHTWNSGMFIWKASRVLQEYERQMPDLYQVLEKIEQAWGTPEQAKVVEENWKALKSETIDYGIMEGADQVAVVPARGLGWNDVGSWTALFEVMDVDKDGNVVNCAEYINVGSSNSLVYTNGIQDRLYVTIGVKDLVIVDTGDVMLVCHKDQAQDVRMVVKLLKEKGKNTYL